MTKGELQAYTKRAAIQPFVIKLTDGQLLEISHPEFVAFPRSPSTFVFFPADGGMLVASLGQVVTLEMLPPEPAALDKQA